jgi:hypothetical protein
MASEITHLNHDRATNNPESAFDTPQSLVEEVGLTRGEKIAALERWAFLVDRRLASGNEGMPTYGTEPRDAELLREIELQIASRKEEKLNAS